MKVKLVAPKPHNGGIQRVVDALQEFLPNYGVEFVDNINDADVVNSHADNIVRTDKPYVVSNHGLWWVEHWGSNVDNSTLISNLKLADIITVPSEFTRIAINRGVLKKTHVINHGVDLSKVTFNKSTDRTKILGFNKTRIDASCRLDDLYRLAELDRSIIYDSTILSRPVDNIQEIGVEPYKLSLERLSNYRIYLSTVLETGDIGALEAVCSGVPVVGWNRGALKDLIKDEGILVDYQDYQGLLKAIETVNNNYDYYLNNCKKARRRFTWKLQMPKYVDAFQEAIDRHNTETTFSIVVTTFNKEAYIEETLQTVKDNAKGNWDCVIVDDASTDNTVELINSVIEGDDRFKLIIHDTNQDVAVARNTGIDHAKGRYAMFLDGDDLLLDTENLLSHVGEADVIYGSLVHDGKVQAWPIDFDLDSQKRKLNCVPYYAMFNRFALEDIGKVRNTFNIGEDAELWLRFATTGYTLKKVTDYPTIWYRRPEGSKSRIIPENDWNKYYNRVQNPVYHFADPFVSIIITTSDEHLYYLNDAITSVFGQSLFSNLEVIVVHDGTEETPYLGRCKVLKVTTGNPARNRNLGVDLASGKKILFLDADDLLEPTALNRLHNKGGELVYGNFTGSKAPEPLVDSYDRLYDGLSIGITFLIDRELFKKLGGFSEDLELYEDWDFEFKVYESGVCPNYINESVLNYRLDTGNRRSRPEQVRKDAVDVIKSKWSFLKENNMKPCCGNKPLPKEELGKPLPEGYESPYTHLIYTGNSAGEQTWQGKYTGKKYKVSTRKNTFTIGEGEKDVHPYDAFGVEINGKQYKGFIHKRENYKIVFKGVNL